MSRSSVVLETLTRPYRVTPPMVLLVALVPLYLFIPALFPPRTLYTPELGLDRALPLLPGSVLLYGPLYLFLIVLPILVVRREEHIRRTVRAYLMVWLTAYAFFVLYPTTAPRPAEVSGDGIGVWGLRALYGMDPPYNCFPSLHVAHSFVSALTCFRLHRRLGVVALAAATLVGLSTLFTKQHYVVDVLAGAALAYGAYLVFLRGYERERVPGPDRSVAPAVSTFLGAVIGAAVLVVWWAYLLSTG